MSSRFTHWRYAPLMGLLLCIGLLGFAVYLPAGAIRDMRAANREVPGTVTIRSEGFCERQDRRVWRCHGTFRSDDGTLVVRDVTFSSTQQEARVVEAVRARLAGPDDRTASREGQARATAGGMAVVSAALLAWLVAQVIWLVRTLRRRARAAVV